MARNNFFAYDITKEEWWDYLYGRRSWDKKGHDPLFICEVDSDYENNGYFVDAVKFHVARVVRPYTPIKIIWNLVFDQTNTAIAGTLYHRKLRLWQILGIPNGYGNVLKHWATENVDDGKYTDGSGSNASISIVAVSNPIISPPYKIKHFTHVGKYTRTTGTTALATMYFYFSASPTRTNFGAQNTWTQTIGSIDDGNVKDLEWSLNKASDAETAIMNYDVLDDAVLRLFSNTAGEYFKVESRNIFYVEV